MSEPEGRATGSLLNGRYEILERLGNEGQFRIFKARDLTEGRYVALKVLRGRTDPQSAGAFRVDTAGVLELAHPNIERAYESDVTGDSAFIAAEYVRGISLKERIARSAPFTMAVALDIAAAVADALNYAHRRGVPHRDLRAHNVVINSEGQVKVVDFGLAQPALGTDASTPLFPSVQYMAPEVVEGKAAGPASDLYSLGVLLYEMAAGRLPFDGETPLATALSQVRDAPVPPSRLNPDVPQPIEDIILKCLRKDPAQRYPNAAALLVDIKTVQHSLRFGRPMERGAVLPPPGPAAPPVATAVPVEKPRRRPAPPPDDDFEDAPGPSILSIAVKTMAAFVVLAILGVLLLIYSILGRPNRDVVVPDVGGAAQDSASVLLSKDGLQPRLESVYSDSVPAGEVIATYPPAGQPVKAGREIVVRVSKGPEKVSVPNVTNLPLADARKTLQLSGLTPADGGQQYDDTVPKGQVESQDPQAGQSVDAGSAVNLVASLGQEPPPPVDQTQPDQTAPSGQTPPPDQTPSGVQMPPPDQTAPSGQSPVAPGQTAPAAPDNGQMPGSTPIPPTTAPGPDRRLRIRFHAPNGTGNQHIRIDITDQNGTSTAYDQDKQPGQEVNQIVHAQGNDVIVRVYANDHKIFEKDFPRTGAQP